MTQRHLRRLRAVRLAAANGRARELRTMNGHSQAEIASAAQVAQSTVALWETGQRVPRGDAALRYADVLESLGPLAVTEAAV